MRLGLGGLKGKKVREGVLRTRKEHRRWVESQGLQTGGSTQPYMSIKQSEKRGWEKALFATDAAQGNTAHSTALGPKKVGRSEGRSLWTKGHVGHELEKYRFAGVGREE